MATQYEAGVGLHSMTLICSGGGLTFADSLTAHAGGTRAAGLPLTTMINHVTTVASATDSVVLPAAVGGQVIVVRNDGANSLTMFAAVGTSDTINTVAAATGVALAAAKTMVLYSVVGAWFGVLTA